MQIQRCKDQTRETLDEHYQRMADYQGSPSVNESGAAMLEVFARLRELPDNRVIYGLTSLSRVCFLSSDKWNSPWYVIFSAMGRSYYVVEYLMPADVAPWPDAYVKGNARSGEEAVQMLLIAMEKSGGWASSSESKAENSQTDDDKTPE